LMMYSGTHERMISISLVISLTQIPYIDYKYFSVEFKKATGISPSEYFYNYK
jgi:YesN/AraC family two-component response regulator